MAVFCLTLEGPPQSLYFRWLWESFISRQANQSDSCESEVKNIPIGENLLLLLVWKCHPELRKLPRLQHRPGSSSVASSQTVHNLQQHLAFVTTRSHVITLEGRGLDVASRGTSRLIENTWWAKMQIWNLSCRAGRRGDQSQTFDCIWWFGVMSAVLLQFWETFYLFIFY